MIWRTIYSNRTFGCEGVYYVYSKLKYKSKWQMIATDRHKDRQTSDIRTLALNTPSRNGLEKSLEGSQRELLTAFWAEQRVTSGETSKEKKK